MKRLFTIGLMLASAFALTNCSQELVDPGTLTDQVTQEEVNSPESGTGVPFKIYASVQSEADTKTQVFKQGTSLKTTWGEGDKIIGVYEKNNSGVFSAPVEFTIDSQDDLSAGVFTANVPESVALDEDNKYNWYFTYGATIAEDNAGVATINIPSVQSQNTMPGSELAHIGGVACPMYGQALNLSGPVFPRVQMKHLATLYEVSVRNDTETNTTNGTKPGNIVVYSFGINTPTAGSWNSADRLKLTGNFKLDLKNCTLKNLGNNTDNITLQLPSDGVTIEPENSDPNDHNNEYKFYFVSAPIDNLQIGATYSDYYLTSNPATIITADAYNALSDENKKLYTGNTIIRKDELQFIVNGSVRSTTLTDKTTLENFTGGKVKKFILPVRSMQRPIGSDALNITSKGRLDSDAEEKVVTIVGPQQTIINGSETPIYVVGSDTEKGTIVIKGFMKELLNALPIGFYASCWNNNPTAMTVRSINIDMPVYDEKGVYIPFIGYIGSIDYSTLEKREPLSQAVSVVSLLGWDLSGGLTRSLLLETIGIDPNTITFNGLIPSNDFEKGNVVIIDEEPVYKEMSVTTVEGFLKKFGQDATLAGLKDIANAEFNGDKINWSTAATATGNAIYNQIKGILSGKVGSYIAGQAMEYLKLKDAEAMMYNMRDMKFEIVIETYPYASSYPATELTTGYQPIVFWGFDAAGTVN